MKQLLTRWRSYRAWRKRTRKVRRRIKLTLFALFLVWYIQCLPDQLFTDSTSTVLLDRHHALLGARIAADGQWRFPETKAVPPKVAVCLVEFEDRNFQLHLGISLKGLARAIVQNTEEGKVVSGGSTLTMQLARLMRKNPPRTYAGKLYEMILATRIEFSYSKQEILALYASHAPFGNNVVGLDAASWRYFGRSPEKLSWAESATLAVLPNAPGLIYPGKNHTLLLQKRNRLLKRLWQTGRIDHTTYALALTEPLPGKPLPLPNLAPHLLDQCIKEGWKGKQIRSTLRRDVQEKAVKQLEIHHRQLADNRIMNGAVIVTDVHTGEILAYVGNTASTETEHGNAVNCIVAPRSTGSILKPLLYGKCLESGTITPKMLVPDIPSQFGSFSPKNYAGSFDGLVPADRALSRSLNIPMVHLLSRYGVTKFRDDLRRFGFSTIVRPAEHYGLSLILGGSEVTLSDLNDVYTRLAQQLKTGKQTTVSTLKRPAEKRRSFTMDRGCIYTMFDAMLEVNRPDEDNNWRIFSSSQKIAWKTGTSFGFRDAWAVGVTPDYVVSVWIGNADGEGRPGLTGVKAAAPLLFDVFRQLPRSQQWFPRPKAEMTEVKICAESGSRANGLCPNTTRAHIPKTALNVPACPYHQNIHLDRTGAFRVDSECESVYDMQHRMWFVLPPVIERYYKANHPDYVPLPDFKPECLAKVTDGALHLVYPKPNSAIYIPVEIGGDPGRVVLEASHRSSSTRIWWHLDDLYIGETNEIHQLAVNPPAGRHRLTVVDENGVTTSVDFEILGSKQ